MDENEIKCFNKMIIYFDNIVKLDTIDRNIWENKYLNEMDALKIKTSKLQFWNNFLNSKSKNENKNISKSFDNDNHKQNDIKGENILNSKSIKNINRFSKKANLDLLGFEKKRKKQSKYLNYKLLKQNKKIENYGVKLSKDPHDLPK